MLFAFVINETIALVDSGSDESLNIVWHRSIVFSKYIAVRIKSLHHNRYSLKLLKYFLLGLKVHQLDKNPLRLTAFLVVVGNVNIAEFSQE